LKEVFVTFATHGGNMLPTLRQAFENIERSAKSIDKDSDIRCFIEEHRSGKPLPPKCIFRPYKAIEVGKQM
jgi:hypothetical protein